MSLERVVEGAIAQAGFRIATVDLNKTADFNIWLSLLDAYAHDPMGGGQGLTAYAKMHLRDQLKKSPSFHGAIAYTGETPVGLINCFSGFSTFAAKPLLNIHDVVVLAPWRRQGVGQALLSWAAARAQALGCCKLTLEVLSNNQSAMAAYIQAGFAPYALDPAAGHALLMQKYLEEK